MGPPIRGNSFIAPSDYFLFFVFFYLSCVCCIPGPATVFGSEVPNSIAVKALGGEQIFYVSNKSLEAMPGNKLATLEGLSVDGSGVVHVNRVDEETLRLLVACVSEATLDGIEGVLIEEKLSPERLAKVIRAAGNLKLNLVRDAAFKRIAGTFSVLHTQSLSSSMPFDAMRLSDDAHTVHRARDGWGYALGRYGCPVGEKMRVKWMIESPMESYEINLGLTPYTNGNFSADVQPNQLNWYAKTGHVDLNGKCCTAFPDAKFHPYFRGDVVEFELDNENGDAKLFLNGLQVGGTLSGVCRGVKMYPVAWLGGAASVRLEVVSVKTPENVVQMVGSLRELM